MDSRRSFPPQAVTLTLNDEIDLSRGDMLVRPKNVPHHERLFEAMVVWMHEEELKEGRNYPLKVGTQQVSAEIADIRYRVDINSLQQVTPKDMEGEPGLGLNEVGRVLLETNRAILFDSYRKNRSTGSFVIIDRMTNVTVGAGMILDRKASGTVSERIDIDRVLARRSSMQSKARFPI